MVENIYKHNSRSYNDVYNAYTKAYPKKPTWLFKENSGLFDFQSELQNRIATDILYPVTRESAYSFATSCDYDPIEADGATCTLTFTLSSSMTKTLAAGYQVGGISTSTGKMIIYELTASASCSSSTTITASAKQMRTIKNRLIGLIDNSDDFADYPIDGYTNIIKDSVSLILDLDPTDSTVTGSTWTLVDNFDSSSSTDKVFRLIYQSSGKCRIQFGDGVTGAKPTIGSGMYLTFAITDGINGKVDADEITYNIGGDSDISSVTNTASSGGNNSESISSIIRNARANVRLKDIIWSEEDLETAARQANSSILKACGVGGIGTSTVYVVPVSSGESSPTVNSTALSAISSYIKALTAFGLMTVNVYNANYTTANITMSVTTRSNFDEDTVKNLVRFALTLITCAWDNQIIEYYQDYGISLCRTDIINAYWDWDFSQDDEEALEFIINNWQVLLGSKEYREFGQSLEIGDIYVIVNSLIDYGVDTLTLTTPTADIEVDDDGYIIATGTITVS